MAKSDQKKAAALAALMECNTLSAAAERAGISRKSLYNYIREDYDFARAYKALQEEAATSALERLEDQEAGALEVVRSLLQDEAQPAGIRLKAAHELLSAAARQREAVAAITAANVSNNEPMFKNLF